MEHLVPVCNPTWIPIGGSSNLRSMTTLLHPHSTTPQIVAASLRSVTHPEGRTGHRERTRRNDRPGDIHSADDRYDHDVDELMAEHVIYLI